MNETQIEQLLTMQAQMLQLLSKNQGAGQTALERRSSFRPVPIDPVARKHSSDMIAIPPPDLSTPANVFEYRPIYDIEGPFGGFFQDGALQQQLVNLLVYPTDGLANMIPVHANNTMHDKHGFLVRYNVAPAAGAQEGDVCEPAIPLTSDYDFMKMETAYGRLAHAVKTLDVTNLILRAQARQYDDFYILGEWRGISARPDIATFRDAGGGLNTDLIVASALRRKLADLGTYFQRQLLNWVWTGDPANTPGGKQIIQPLGMYRLVNGQYATSGLPVTTTAHVGGPAAATLINALSSIVVNLEGKRVGDGSFSLFQTLQDVELLLWQRARGTGLDPVQWKIFMITPLWEQIVKHLSCEMVKDGCVIPGGGVDKVLNLNDGGTALMNMTLRRQMEQSQSITLNGRTYPVVLDDTMPYTVERDDQDNFLGYKSDIFWIPFTAAGQEVLYWEYIDYSQIYNELQPLSDRALDAKGWTDNGYFYHMITTLRSCVEMQTEMQMRLIFKAPHLAARLDNLVSWNTYQYPLYLDGAGTPAGWLVPPAA